MNKFITKKIFKAIFTIWFVYTIIFILTRVTGDPVQFMTIDGASDSARAQLRENLGLNLPLYQQYINSFLGLFTGDAGNSYYYGRAVSGLFAERLLPTIYLGVSTFLITLIIGLSLGVIAAINHNNFVDKLIMVLSIIGNTIPNFILSIILIFIFSLRLRMLPSGGYGNLRNFVMPIIAMSVGPISSLVRLTRSSMLDVLNEDYMEHAKAKGLSDWKVIIEHGLRNALIPIITILGVQMSSIIGGSVVIESVFSWPGIGKLIVDSAMQRDFPVVVFGVLIISISVTVINLLVDISYAYIDPRIN